MFWNVFYELCISNGTKPNPVAKALGISSATVTKWKNGATPSLCTAKKIADHFGVSVDSLVGNTSVAPVSDITSVGISAEEIELLRAYRAHPEMQAAVNRLLGIKEVGGAYMYTAAHSTDKHCDAVTYVDKEALIRLEEAPETDDTLM